MEENKMVVVKTFNLNLGQSFLSELRRIKKNGQGTLLIHPTYFQWLKDEGVITLNTPSNICCRGEEFMVMPIKIRHIKSTGKVRVKFSARFNQGESKEPVL
jgi:hypothetical protein